MIQLCKIINFSQESNPQTIFQLPVSWLDRKHDAVLSERDPRGFACKLFVTRLPDVSLMSEAADVTNIQSQCCGKKMKHADA
jgi:hypothetical protein